MGFVTAAFEHKTIRKHTKVSALGREYNGHNAPEKTKADKKLLGNDLINPITFLHNCYFAHSFPQCSVEERPTVTRSDKRVDSPDSVMER